MTSNTSNFSKLEWLKRTNGHKFNPTEFRVLLAIFNHSDKFGRDSFPGRDLLMAETTKGKSEISKAVTSLKRRGWIIETKRGSSFEGQTSVYELVPDAPTPPSAMSGNSDTVGVPPMSEKPDMGGLAMSGYAHSVCPETRTPTDPLPDPKDLVVVLTDPKEDISGDDTEEVPATASDVSASSTVTAEGAPATEDRTRLFWVPCPEAPDLNNLETVPAKYRPTAELVGKVQTAIRFVIDECQGMDFAETAAALAAQVNGRVAGLRNDLETGLLSGYVMLVDIEE